MSDDVRILTLSDRAVWEQEHRRDGLPSQSWSFASALVASAYEPRLAVVQSKGSRMLLPYFERQWQGTTDIATLPGLSGASILPHSPAPLALWREFAISRGWIAGYIQLAPRIALDDLPERTRMVRQNSLFVLDPSTWSLQTSTYRTIRQKVALALRLGASVVEGAAALRESLQALYPATLERFGSASKFSRSTLQQWCDDPDNLLVGVMRNGIVEGVHLIHVAGRHAEAHLGGLTEASRDLSVLLYTHAIDRLAARGVDHYNLGAGGDEGDGVYNFKKWLGAEPLALRSVQQIYDADRYAQLCAAAGASDEDPRFPPYRFASSATDNGRHERAP